MFKNKNTEFWFWVLLGFVNVFTIMVANQNHDQNTVIFGYCILTLCFIKALVCAIQIETKD